MPSWRCDDETRHLRADARVRRRSHDTCAAGYPGASGSSTAANGAVSSSAAAASGGTVDGFFLGTSLSKCVTTAYTSNKSVH